MPYDQPSATETISERVEQLRNVLDQLPASRQEFARSLCNSFARYGRLSDRQEPWIARLLDIAQGRTTQAAPSVQAQIGDLAGIRQMFNRALASRLRRPAIVLSCGSDTLRLSIAGEQSRVPGSINVTSTVRNDAFGRNLWYGRITEDGTFTGSPRVDATETVPVVARLREFAADPARVAGEHGRLTGRCCFCNRGLEDERSTEVGYGPVCARHFGLPWGSRTSAAALAALDAPRPEAVVNLRVGRGTVSIENVDGSFRNVGEVTLTPVPLDRATMRVEEYTVGDIARLVQTADLPARPPRRVAPRPVTQQRVDTPPASSTRIDEMPLGVRGDLE